MDLAFFRKLLSIDSTSGRERTVAEWLFDSVDAPARERFEVGDGTLNLLFSWGTPKVVFCSHMDTVPPYIAPSFEGGVVRGRGSCDAKGQIVSMLEACRRLSDSGADGFGLLLLSGEETGSWGAKAFARTGFQAPFLIIGEPTENRMVSAAKGTKSFDLVFHGKAFHSGYPGNGVSAVDLFNRFYNDLKAKDFGIDPELGETTWNIGLLKSDNPQNILSPELTCRLYFRTTFVSDEAVQSHMATAGDGLTVIPRGGDEPARYVTLDGFPSGPVAFGSDAPHLTNFGHKIICGPGSINHAHRDDEHILVADMETAVDQYIMMFKALTGWSR